MAATAYCKTEGQVDLQGLPGPLDLVKTVGFSQWQPPHTVKQKVKWTSWVPEGHLTL